MARPMIAHHRHTSSTSSNSSLTSRKQPLLGTYKSLSEDEELYPIHKRSVSAVTFGEVAGGTTADCAAVACCCPCVVVELLVLTMYRLPAGLCRKALQKKRRRRLLKKGVLPQRSCRCNCGCDDTELQIHPITADMSPAADKLMKSLQEDKDVIQLEKEMWDKFYGAGFWRSPSQRSN